MQMYYSKHGVLLMMTIIILMTVSNYYSKLS